MNITCKQKKRFLDKVDKSGDCWLWTGTLRKCGYGQIGFNGKVYRAHRVSYDIHNGEIPKGLIVCHTCDNPPCVNPAHLYAGTPMDNTTDMMLRGRHGRTKLKRKEGEGA